MAVRKRLRPRSFFLDIVRGACGASRRMECVSPVPGDGPYDDGVAGRCDLRVRPIGRARHAILRRRQSAKMDRVTDGERPERHVTLRVALPELQGDSVATLAPVGNALRRRVSQRDVGTGMSRSMPPVRLD